MARNSLDHWSAAVRSAWGPLSSRTVEHVRSALEALAASKPGEEWLDSLRRDRTAARELYRDPASGFVLQAHSEAEGQYRPPHDHGDSWVVYAVVEGEVDMGSWASLPGADGRPLLVKRSSTRMTAGQAQVYLPGDIHDTLCVKGPALLLRFTERDLRIEKEQGRMTRFVELGGMWTTAEAASAQ